MVIGITGKSCSGKNKVTSLFEERGYVVIDLDHLGHEALRTTIDEVTKVFGTSIIDANGDIDRKLLGKIVFSSKKQMAKLEKIVHPKITALAIGKLKSLNETPAVINGALIHDLGLASCCNVIVWVESPLLERFKRARKRDHQSCIFIIQRLLLQRKINFKNFPQNADVIKVSNCSDILNLKDQVNRIADKLAGGGRHGGRTTQ